MREVEMQDLTDEQRWALFSALLHLLGVQIVAGKKYPLDISPVFLKTAEGKIYGEYGVDE